ncbi:MAG TPA: hypothetical protein VMR86_07200 [Myxococcota bacterium]|nr:hypothetical protein [Myxococcota bacterium]
MSRARSHWPLYLAALAFALQTAVLLWLSRRLTDGHLVYALDDAYIHMAMAKNLAHHGVWGVTPFGFSSSSSSPLWVVILAAIERGFGGVGLAPLLLNLVSGLGLLALGHFALRDFAVSRGQAAAALLALVVFLPMAPLALVAMEHLLQTALALGFAWQIVRQARRPTRSGTAVLLALGFALAALRYEDLALALAGAAVLAFRRRRVDALLLSVAALAAPAAYAALALAHGETPIPNSLLLKGNLPHAGLSGLIHLLGYTACVQLSMNPHMLVLMVGGLFAVGAVRGQKQGRGPVVRTLLFLCLATTLFQLQFGGFGSFYRYEAYLVALWLLAIAAALPALVESLGARMRRGSDVALLACGLALFGVPLAVRFVQATINAPVATRNIYEQQYQMGRFLARYYPERGVAVNDIGAVDYLAELRLLDLWGLANSDVMRARRAKQYGAGEIEELARVHGTEVAVIYADWFDGSGGLPPGWVRVGQWTIADNRICGGPTVTFFAVIPGEAPALAAHLREFSSELPATVAQRGAYLSASN